MVDVMIDGIRAMVVIIKKAVKRIFVNGMIYVRISFGVPGIKKMMNKMMDKCLESKRNRN